MARITVEDCIEKVPNRYELIALAAQRSRQLKNGAELTLEKNDDKSHVVALREIALGSLKHSDIEDDIVRSFQKEYETSAVDEDVVKKALKTRTRFVTNTDPDPALKNVAAGSRFVVSDSDPDSAPILFEDVNPEFTKD